MAETRTQLEKRTACLISNVDLDSLKVGDVVNLKNRGRIIYDGKDKGGKLIFYGPGDNQEEVKVWLIERDRIEVIDGVVRNGQVHFYNSNSSSPDTQGSQTYERRRTELNELGLI